MIPKLETCLEALDDGVGAAHVLDGRLPHVLLLETFTEAGRRHQAHAQLIAGAARSRLAEFALAGSVAFAGKLGLRHARRCKPPCGGMTEHEAIHGVSGWPARRSSA